MVTNDWCITDNLHHKHIKLCYRDFVLRISVISPTFPVLMDLRESVDHLWFPKYPEYSSGLKEIRISSIFITRITPGGLLLSFLSSIST